jgi:LPXTG-site transpeptidase (sortase) family protein
MNYRDSTGTYTRSRHKRYKYRKHKSHVFYLLPKIFITLAIIILMVGFAIALKQVLDNRATNNAATVLLNAANHGASNGVPRTVEPTNSEFVSYKVAPNLPRYLIIPKLGVDARILSVGVTSTGAISTPNNVYDTAWYNESAKPGQPGAVLIDGHVSSMTAHGVFYELKMLVAGDIIKIERGDGEVFNYRVVKSRVYLSSDTNMAEAMAPVVSGKQGLNLITCTGDVIPGTNHFNERIVVFTEQE